MAISQWFHGVIFRKAFIETRYPGGIDAFIGDLPNKSLRDDGELLDVSSISGVDHSEYIQLLEARTGARLSTAEEPGEMVETYLKSTFHRPEWLEKIAIARPRMKQHPWSAN